MATENKSKKRARSSSPEARPVTLQETETEVVRPVKKNKVKTKAQPEENKQKKKVQQQAPSPRKGEVHLDGLVIVRKLTEAEVETIRGGMLAQVLCGKAKKETRTCVDGVWKGPYDTTKSGDVDKLRRMVTRQRQMQQWGVPSPSLDLFEAPSAKGIWLACHSEEPQATRNLALRSKYAEQGFSRGLS